MGRITARKEVTIPLKNPGRGKRRIALFVAAGLVGAAVFISLFRDMGVVDSWKLDRTERQLRDEVVKLRQENAILKQTVEDLRSNPAVIEQEARRIGLIKEGENVIVVPPKPDASSKTPVKLPPTKRP